MCAYVFFFFFKCVCLWWYCLEREIESERGSTACACVCACVRFFFCVVSGGMCAHTCGYVCVWRAGWPRVCAYVFFFFESVCVC